MNTKPYIRDVVYMPYDITMYLIFELRRIEIDFTQMHINTLDYLLRVEKNQKIKFLCRVYKCLKIGLMYESFTIDQNLSFLKLIVPQSIKIISVCM